MLDPPKHEACGLSPEYDFILWIILNCFFKENIGCESMYLIGLATSRLKLRGA